VLNILSSKPGGAARIIILAYTLADLGLYKWLVLTSVIRYICAPEFTNLPISVLHQAESYSVYD
jgi:hypothetical protein